MWCGIHHPPAVEARKKARDEKWDLRWGRQQAVAGQRDAALDAIRQIAAGHNAPRELARTVLAMVEE